MSKFKTVEDALEDLYARFLYNLPESELLQVDRLFFQLEQAWWFYEDFMADMNDALPHFKQLKTFSERVFSHCPLLSKSKTNFSELFNNFSAYKAQIPVCGCIILNPDMTKVVLVCTWKGKSWGFPRGKINEKEGPLACAIREVFEECGFDATAHCKEDDQLVVIEESKAINLFVATNVPESTMFMPQTRKEISEVAFFSLDELPKSTYGVYPFIPKLRRWIAMNQRTRGKRNGKGNAGAGTAPTSKSSPKVILSKSASTGAMLNSKGFDARNADTFAEDLMQKGGLSKGWNVAEMFRANAQLTGITSSQYDGNPHSFGASHPRYVDYSKKGGGVTTNAVPGNGNPVSLGRAVSVASLLASAAISAASSSAAGDAASKQQHGQGRGARLDSSTLSTSSDSVTANQPSSTSFVWTASQRLPRPFVLAKQEIMAAMDGVLLSTAVLAFPTD